MAYNKNPDNNNPRPSPPPAPVFLSPGCRYSWMNGGDLERALGGRGVHLSDLDRIRVCLSIADALLYWFVQCV
jgi:hypothetical protein